MEINKVYNENCLDTMAKMEDNFIDLIVTSPPYDNLRKYTGEAEWNFEVFQNVAKELYRVTKQGGVVVWIVGDATIKGSETGTSFKQALYFKELGFNLHDTMIWNKESCPFPDKTRYYQSFEYMFIFTKGNINKFNPICDRKNKWANTSVHGTLRQQDGSLVETNGKKFNRKIKEYGSRFNIWNISPERNNKYNHPAVFPEQLVSDHIISWSNKGDLVYDCFAGSGTTVKMAILNNRQYIASEISKEYCDIIEERINITK